MDIQITHTLNAPIEKVWHLWNDPESIKKWWSPQHFKAPVIKNDFRVGGSFLYSMQAPDGQMSWNVGTYLEIVQHKKILVTMSFANEKGHVVPASEYGIPGEWPTEVTILAEFRELNGVTEVTITETGIPSVMSVFAKMGWQQQFDKFDLLIQ